MACLLASALGTDGAFTVADTTDAAITGAVDTGADIMDDLDLTIGRVMVIEAADTVADSDAAVAADSAVAIMAAFTVVADSAAAIVAAFAVAADSAVAMVADSMEAAAMVAFTVVADSMVAVAADLTVADMAAAIGN
jgi:hypothetical protein